jgi:hypothetical protein
MRVGDVDQNLPGGARLADRGDRLIRLVGRGVARADDHLVAEPGEAFAKRRPTTPVPGITVFT